MSNKKTILINTSTFAQFSKIPINILEDENYTLIMNDKGRKLSEKENIEIIS